jgi:hypothetical protein
VQTGRRMMFEAHQFLDYGPHPRLKNSWMEHPQSQGGEKSNPTVTLHQHNATRNTVSDCGEAWSLKSSMDTYQPFIQARNPERHTTAIPIRWKLRKGLWLSCLTANGLISPAKSPIIGVYIEDDGCRLGRPH